MSEALQWRGKDIGNLPNDILLQLYKTLTAHFDKRAGTTHNTRTNKLNINFKYTSNKYFIELLAAVKVQLEQKGLLPK